MQTAARREQFTPTAHTPKSIFQHTDLFPVFVTLHPGTMLKMNLPELTLCLLGTVLLCGATTVEPPITITSGPTTPAVTSNKPTTPAGTSNKPTTAAGTTTSSTGTTVSSSGDTAATGTVTNNPTSSTVTTESVGDSSSGLSSGAIAGITIGSIAGVAAVGGGIFGALKYTARI
ncbi:A-agglutinin anchorage subunit-like isoform X2 [Larimichthys crocea]|uniref:A-agglutinin anchorage subunit-like isoform X2 n=1 Tax=Larimichthys crocea TaxID=215358 RepID=UPI000F5D59B7|nr:A-agglutinin anchorage subunit-like isoform X2 [Larimichthys crocea]